MATGDPDKRERDAGEYDRVSVIVPVYNGARFLAQALDSIVGQTFPPFETIVVDGPSTDISAEIARSYQGVSYLRQSGEGMWDALNQGIAAAHGELIAFLSSDDIWMADKLELQSTALAHHPELEFVTARVKFFLEEDTVLDPVYRPAMLEGDHVGLMPETLLVRKSFLGVFGGFDMGLSAAADVEWFARALGQRTPMQVIPRVLLHKRLHGANLLNAPATAKVYNQELLDIVRHKLVD